ncbi:RNA dependent RNA polymerase-domain-containing protein [Circinella umbellata]|nr:RNA dependent RNA polymerase-domain-containing protein [Circinella umbellata]
MVLNRLEELPAHLDPQCLLISNLNRDTYAETLFEFFNKFQDVEHVEIDLDKQNRSKGSAIILFVQPLTNYNIILSKFRIDGKLIVMGFAPKGFVSTHSWRETSKRPDHIGVPAVHFSLGTMLASKTFVDLWSYPKDIQFTMNFNLRQISIYFRHLEHRYRMDFGFNNINGEMKMEREGLSTHLTFTLWCPARTWRETVVQREQKPQQQPYMINGNNTNNNVRNDYNNSIPSPSPLRTNRSFNNTNNTNNNMIRATKTTTDRIWERVLDIPLDKNAQILINRENEKSKRERTPVFPEYLPHRVNLAAWRTYRIKFEPPEHMLKDFETMLKNAAHYNLISREFNLRRQLPLRVLPASQLPQKPHNHIERAKKLEDFDVLYYLECAITQGLIDEINLDNTLYEVLNEIGSTNQQYPRGILKALLEEENSRVWKPYDAISKVFNQKSLKVASSTAVPDHCVLIRKVIVTPTTMYLQPPTLEVTNRVIRHFSAYADRFLRVQFVDEGMTRVAAAFDAETSDVIYSRIYKVLQGGIQIGTRRYDFLAFSSSQLRGHGCWFFAPTRELSCGMIRSWMGSFTHVKTVAKRAVRMGQVK